MSRAQPITYGRIAEVLTELGMVSREQARGVVEDFARYAAEELDTLRDIVSALESFEVAVSIHADDVDFADEHYEWLLEEAASLTGGAVTVSDYRFDKANEDDEEDGRGEMHFRRNGEPLTFFVEQESNDYLDMGAAQAAVEALSPDDDRDFRCVDNGPKHPLGTTNDVMVLATAEQRAGLEHRLGITFREPM